MQVHDPHSIQHGRDHIAAVAQHHGPNHMNLVQPGSAAALPTTLHNKMEKILVFELTATNLRGTLRQLTRKELLEEARAASLPEAVRAGGSPASDLLLLKARDVRKVDPVFGGRIEPVILVRTGVILVSLGRTELRALILHDRHAQPIGRCMHAWTGRLAGWPAGR